MKGKYKKQGSRKEKKKILLEETKFESMTDRPRNANKFAVGSPPTHDYFYGTCGRRWAGLGKKAANKNWKSNRLNQWN